MPSSKSKEPHLKLTISLREVVELQTENAALKKQVSELQEKCDLLEKQVRDFTEPEKKAEAAAFKTRRRQV